MGSEGFGQEGKCEEILLIGVPRDTEVKMK
jgi:hypothetical protein